jgi:GNAT superfamily N-acetyltransferase
MHQPKKDYSDSIVCRPALPFDTPEMIELTRHIWEGQDYVPEVWSQWMHDSQGLLAVAQLGGKVVGLGKLTRLSQSDWWLEGLRVHPDYEGRGIASHLNAYLLDYWQRIGTGVIRLATMSTREPVKHLAMKNGFQLIAEYATYQSRIPQSINTEPGASTFQPIVSAEIAEAVDWLIDPNQGRLAFGMMDLGWQYAEPKPEYFSNYVNNRQAWWWRDRQGMLIMVDKKENSETWARIRLFACEGEDFSAFVSEVDAFAGQSGYAGINWKIPPEAQKEEVLSDAGYQREKEHTLLIFEKHYPED